MVETCILGLGLQPDLSVVRREELWASHTLHRPLNSILSLWEPRVEGGEQEGQRKIAQAWQCVVCSEGGSLLLMYH